MEFSSTAFKAAINSESVVTSHIHDRGRSQPFILLIQDGLEMVEAAGVDLSRGL